MDIFKSREKVVKILLGLSAAGLLLFLAIIHPRKTSGAISSASSTLSNSRLSFSGQVSVGQTAGQNVIDIKITGNIADVNTNHLFPNDTVSVGINGGKTVATIVDSNTFALSSGLTVSVADGATIYSTQSGILTIAFTESANIPANGYVKFTIADPPSAGNDGAPDTTSSITTNGFDLNLMGTGNVAVTGGTGCSWGTETLTAGSGSGHTYKVVNTAASCTGTITATIGNSTIGLVNPAPIYSGHTQGLADIYTVTAETYGSGNELISTVDMKIAPVEAVLVSATVEETLSFQVESVVIGTTACGRPATVTSQAYSVPWGTLSTANSFSNVDQKLTVSTNSDNGYSVTIEENDQMGRDGTTCDSPADHTADETDNPPCIKDTTCDTSCSESAEDDWETAANNGLGFSLANISGTDATFTYKVATGGCVGTADTDFCARQIADLQGSSPETKNSIMTNSGSVSGRSAYVCYQISISATQPAGYYYNKVKYTATATF